MLSLAVVYVINMYEKFIGAALRFERAADKIKEGGKSLTNRGTL